MTFKASDKNSVSSPHNDLLVVKILIANCKVLRVLVDTRSSVNLIFRESLQRMELRGYKHKSRIRSLTSFAGKITMSVGTIELHVQVGGVIKIPTFTIISKPVIYNIIMGTSWLHTMEAVPLLYHQCLKFPMVAENHTLRGSKSAKRACSMIEPGR
ncbi:hypothetical protein N665_1913s0003 [Sinapis alba]|nr:hypothetical protein N665_1913s0003 [Sinapis alba]